VIGVEAIRSGPFVIAVTPNYPALLDRSASLLTEVVSPLAMTPYRAAPWPGRLITAAARRAVPPYVRESRFSPSFAPRPGQEASNACRGGDRPSSTDLELHARHHVSRSPVRWVHSLRHVRPRIARDIAVSVTGVRHEKSTWVIEVRYRCRERVCSVRRLVGIATRAARRSFGRCGTLAIRVDRSVVSW
jgi:hypothetical protein